MVSDGRVHGCGGKGIVVFEGLYGGLGGDADVCDVSGVGGRNNCEGECVANGLVVWNGRRKVAGGDA